MYEQWWEVVAEFENIPMIKRKMIILCAQFVKEQPINISIILNVSLIYKKEVSSN